MLPVQPVGKRRAWPSTKPTPATATFCSPPATTHGLWRRARKEPHAQVLPFREAHVCRQARHTFQQRIVLAQRVCWQPRHGSSCGGTCGTVGTGRSCPVDLTIRRQRSDGVPIRESRNVTHMASVDDPSTRERRWHAAMPAPAPQLSHCGCCWGAKHAV